jgi:hypothetical protein
MLNRPDMTICRSDPCCRRAGRGAAGADWIAPEMARQEFAGYAEQWLRDRVLKVRTLELYRGLLGNHLLPTFGTMAMGDR